MLNKITVSPVNFRTGPSVQDSIITLLEAGKIVQTRSDHAWRPVTVDGQDGWIAETYLANPPEFTGLIYNPNQPREQQVQDWTCSIRSVMWCLESIGIKTTAAEMQDSMVAAGLVDQANGLEDASGSGVVKYLKDYWSVTAYSYSPIEYADLYRLAGTGPIAAGGRNFGGSGYGHWVAVRERTPDGNVNLANPAHNPPFNDAFLTPATFAAKGWWSAIYIPV